jgi:hypothetical protein
MNRAWCLCLLGGILAGTIGAVRDRPSEEHILVLMGDTKGYLSPCGCTKPMTGGIRRRASAIRMLTSGKPATLLENGGFVKGTTEQDRLKAEALAESLRHMGVTACNLTANEAKLGAGVVLSLRNLAGELFVQSNLKPSPTNSLQSFIPSGPFLIGAAGSNHAQVARSLGETSEPNDAAVKRLVAEAQDAGLAPILMLADGVEEAERLAKEVPGLRLIQYRSTDKPANAPTRVGDTLLVSPGEHSKFVVRLTFAEGEFKAYSAIELGPEYSDDPAVSRVYRRYLRRVEEEKLLEELPRSSAPRFAGTAACLPCHRKAAKALKTSSHSFALRTLIKDGHGRDPDCVGCHVVGLDKTTGFRSVRATPQLANVGCEACHGPGAAHSAAPKKIKLGKVGPASCQPCHKPENSPGFEFGAYWKRIAH